MRKVSIFILCLLLSCSKDVPAPEEPVPTQYTLTIAAGEGGSVSPDANGTYDEGTTTFDCIIVH